MHVAVFADIEGSFGIWRRRQCHTGTAEWQYGRECLTADVNAVIAESVRVLKAGGVYLYDTVNRTWFSKFMMITLVQKWLRIVPPNLHDWKKFITPKELHDLLMCHGLEPRDMVGLIPRMNPIISIKRLFDIRKLKRGEKTYAEFGRGMVFRTSRLTFMNYMGYAIKPLRSP